MSRSSLPTAATLRRTLPGLALSCLGAALATGCLDDDRTIIETAGGEDSPLSQVAVAEPATSALPPKPALARFATATGAMRRRALDAALGKDVSDLYLDAVGAALAPTACPGSGRRGNLVYSTPDCVDAGGVHRSGRLLARFGGDAGPLVIELERWSADAADALLDTVYNGTVTVHPDGRVDANLEVFAGGVMSHTFASWRHSHDHVRADAGSWVIIRDLGIADILGAWRLPAGSDEAPSGTLELDGADTLGLDFDRAESDCAPIVLDGEVVGKRCGVEELSNQLAHPDCALATCAD